MEQNFAQVQPSTTVQNVHNAENMEQWYKYNSINALLYGSDIDIFSLHFANKIIYPKFNSIILIVINNILSITLIFKLYYLPLFNSECKCIGPTGHGLYDYP
jgi:hypothetical protein